MKGMSITLFCIAASLILACLAFAQFPQHFAAVTPLPLWTWTINQGGVPTHIPMMFSNIIDNQELPAMNSFYGVTSGSWVRWYFRGSIKKPISDLFLCVTGRVVNEQSPQWYGPEQPRIAAWALPAGYHYPQPFTNPPLPETGSWNPFYLTARGIPVLTLLNVVLSRTLPGIPGGLGINNITLIDGFEICLLIRLPVAGIPTFADFDGDKVNPLFSIIQNDDPATGLETEVTLAFGDMIAVQIDMPSDLYNIYLDPTSSVFVKYLTPNP